MSVQKDDNVGSVGPLHFVGRAVELDACVKEDNDHEAVNLTEWMQSLHSQDQEMSDSENDFFATLRSRAQ